MTLETEIPKLVLRHWKVEDAPRLCKLWDPSVEEFMFDSFLPPETEREAIEWLMRYETNPFQMAMVYEGVVCGCIGAMMFPPGNMEFTALLIYWVGREYRRRGFAVSAVQEFVRDLFEHTNIVRVEGTVLAKNVASIKTLERAGFIMEGNLEKAGFKNGELHDVLVFGKIRPNALPLSSY